MADNVKMKRVDSAKYIIALCMLFGATTLYAQNIYYTTKITQTDRYNTHGKKLHTVRAILRQDRYNSATPGYFYSKNRRGLFDSAKIHIANRHLKHQIIHSKRPVWISVAYYPKKHLFTIYQPD